MSSSLESIGELIDSHGLTIADIEFILKYLVREKISSQLAMRRIKSFDVLKAKLEDNSDQEIIKELKEQLDAQEKEFQSDLEEKEKLLQSQIEEKDSALKTLITEKTDLESKNEELQNLSELFESEREELKNQLKIIGDFGTPEDEENPDTSNINQIIDIISYAMANNGMLEPIIHPILTSLKEIVDESAITIDRNKYNKTIESFVNNLPSQQSKALPSSSSSQSSSFDTSQEQEKESTKKPASTSATKPKKKVDDKVIQVLNLFLDFLTEADEDKNFQDRVSTICEMDEAYEHLGSIGLSQVYSFVSKGIGKKAELVKLIESWKVDGVPR